MWVCACAVCGMETIPPPTEKTSPMRRQEGKHKGQGLKKEWWPVMNISGIPQLQAAAAAGFSIGEVDVLAKGHQGKTLQEAPRSPYWPHQS